MQSAHPTLWPSASTPTQPSERPTLELPKWGTTPPWHDKQSFGFADSHQPSQHIYFSFSSEGFGHSSRALAIAKQLQPHQYTFATYGQAKHRLEGLGFAVKEIPQELKLIGNAGGFDLGKTILENQSLGFAFSQAVQHELELMKQCRAGVVVVDGRMAALAAASLLELPCLVLTNQSAFYPFFHTELPWLQWLGHSFDALMKMGFSVANEILIPDFAPPYTVCLPNLTHHPKVKKQTRFIGPLVGFEADTLQPAERPHPHHPRVVASLGGHAYRQPLLEALLQTASQLTEIEFLILTNLTPVHAVPANVTLVAGCNEGASYFKSADVVVTQAGHSTAMELMCLGVPCVVVPDTKQIEQENNAQRLQELGMGIRLTYADLQQQTLASTLQHLFANQCEPYRSHAQHYARLAKEAQASQQTARLLLEYAHRLVAY
ncbi:MAG: glycosyltransferase [Vampirovibrionales bacterium]